MSARNTDKLQLAQIEFQINKNKRFVKARLCFSTCATIVLYNSVGSHVSCIYAKIKFVQNQAKRGIVGTHFTDSVNPYYSQF